MKQGRSERRDLSTTMWGECTGPYLYHSPFRISQEGWLHTWSRRTTTAGMDRNSGFPTDTAMWALDTTLQQNFVLAFLRQLRDMSWKRTSRRL